jgi:aspartyl-tRNA(Asn)/glutamyl-tRNA(Gln) amidotransferase subunit A
LKRYNTLREVRSDIASGAISCVTLTQYYLDNIERKKHLNAYVEVYANEALAQAAIVDEKIKAGTAGKLAGMVVGLKDVLCHKGHGVQASSKILSGFISQFNGTAVQRLIDEDAIIIGRQNCDEFAMGSSNENSAFGPVLNEIDPTRVPGGSSGGTAVAVQADTCLVSLGSDTGGSVRQPAAFCGIVGFKPTYSRISRYGLLAYASSFDSIGIIARSIEDTALVLEVIAGSDDNDSTVSTTVVPEYSKSTPYTKKASVCYLKEALESPGVADDIKEVMRKQIASLQAKGHTVEPVAFPLLDYILPTYYILTTAEASSNLSRYDGVKYGYRSSNATDLLSLYTKTRSEGFGKEVKKRIMLGTFVLSAGFYDAYYTKAQKIRRLIKETTEGLLQQYDFVLTPTTTTTAFKIGDHSGDPISMYLADIFTVQANICGIPAISFPKGTDANGLPIGLQLMTRAFEEESLLTFTQSLLDD